jgi:hypothetical protein
MRKAANHGGTNMKMRFQIIIEYDGNQGIVEEIGCLHKGDLSPETLGLTLNEAKELLAGAHKTMVQYQTDEYISRHSRCSFCHIGYSRKDSK